MTEKDAENVMFLFTLSLIGQTTCLDEVVKMVKAAEEARKKVWDLVEEDE